MVTVRSGCPELCPRARGSARAGEGGGCWSRGSTRRGSKGKASERPRRVRGSCGSLPAGRGAGREGALLSPPTGTLFAAPFGVEAAAVASGRLWGEPAGLGGGDPESAGSGPRRIQCPEPEDRPEAPPTPSGLCPAAPVCEGGGGGWVPGPEIPQHRDGAVTGGRGHLGPCASRPPAAFLLFWPGRAQPPSPSEGGRTYLYPWATGCLGDPLSSRLSP